MAFVRLCTHDDQLQAQLEGFKTRALRAEAPAQRNLYVTEWRMSNLVEGRVPGAGFDVRPLAVLGDAGWEPSRRTSRAKAAAAQSSMVGAWAVAVDGAPSARGMRALPAFEVALTLVQTQAVPLPPAPVPSAAVQEVDPYPSSSPSAPSSPLKLNTSAAASGGESGAGQAARPHEASQEAAAEISGKGQQVGA